MIGQWQERNFNGLKNIEKEEYDKGLKSEWPWEEKTDNNRKDKYTWE